MPSYHYHLAFAFKAVNGINEYEIGADNVDYLLVAYGTYNYKYITVVTYLPDREVSLPLTAC